MKLWEAILKGCEGTYQISEYSDGRGGCCAKGAALRAFGKSENDFRWLERKYHNLVNLSVEYPLGKFSLPLFVCIDGLNSKRWTREQIAAWVRTIEEPQARLTSPEERVGQEMVEMQSQLGTEAK